MTPDNHDPARPEAVDAALNQAERLEYWTLFWLIAIVVVMGLVAGGSQAFRTAWIEDMLSLLAPALFLVTRAIERRPPTDGFPYGFHRAGSLAFFAAAVALATIGGLLLYEGAMALIRAEHPTIGSYRLFGREVWIGWLMIGALVFSIIPPVIVGQKKKGCAKILHDKVLWTDAETNAADWKTGAAGIAGIAGIALGLWWADAAMAVLISLSILKDGVQGIRISTIALLDGAPRRLASTEIDPEAHRIVEELTARYDDACVQIRETGRYFRVTVEPHGQPHLPRQLAETLMREDSWRLIETSLAIRTGLPARGEKRPPEI